MGMETNWAVEQLSNHPHLDGTFRDLPAGAGSDHAVRRPPGGTAAAIGLALHLDSMEAFAGLWLGTAALAVAGAFLIARRQAFKDHEAFWSPPTRRVAQALMPPLLAGMCLGLRSSVISASQSAH